MKNLETELKIASCLVHEHRHLLSERNRHRLLEAAGGTDLLQSLKELLACVDERCGGKAKGNSRLVRACDEARAQIEKWKVAA